MERVSRIEAELQKYGVSCLRGVTVVGKVSDKEIKFRTEHRLSTLAHKHGVTEAIGEHPLRVLLQSAV